MQITLDSTPELQNKHTIFGRVAGSTIYNVLALANVELSESEPDRPVYPPKLDRAEVVHNPFPDLVPRITPEERKLQEQAKAMAAERADALKRKTKRPKKNVTLLSFGSEEDAPLEKRAKKPMSSHDLLEDKRLSKKPHHEKRLEQEQDLDTSASSRIIQPPVLPEEKSTADPVSPSVVEMDDAVSTSVTKPKRSSGRDLLKSIVDQYKQDKNVAKPARVSDTLGLIDSLREKTRDRPTLPKELSNVSGEISSASIWGDDEDMHEYGAEEDDDVNWRSHKYVPKNSPQV